MKKAKKFCTFVSSLVGGVHSLSRGQSCFHVQVLALSDFGDGCSYQGLLSCLPPVAVVGCCLPSQASHPFFFALCVSPSKPPPTVEAASC